jgi:hypothetical protein
MDIKGVVRGGTPEKPLAYASVLAYADNADSNKPAIAFALTDSGGRYQLSLDRQYDTMYLEISHLGFSKLRVTILRGDRNNIGQDLHLVPAGSELPPANVTAIPKIIQKKDTIIFNADSYKDLKQKTIGDLLKNIPGFEVKDGRISFNGKPVDRVLIENEDLFNSEYSPLIDNASPADLDKVELLSKYKDNSVLADKFSAEKGQAVNLVFKKKKAIRSYGSVAGGTDGSSQYQGSLDLLSLMPKGKSLLIANTNDIGRLGQSLLGQNALAAQNSELLPGAEQPSRFISLPGISSNEIGADRFTYNHSATAYALSQFNLVHIIKAKAQFEDIDDKFFQYQHTKQGYYTQTPPLILTENDTFHKANRYTGVGAAVTATPSNALQASYTFSWYGNPNHLDIAEDLNGLNNTQQLYQHPAAFTHVVQSTLLLDDKNLVTVKAGFASYTGPEHLTVFPFFPDSIFEYSGVYTHQQQNVWLRSRFFTPGVIYSRKMPDGNLTWENSLKREDHDLLSQTTVFNRQDSTYALGNGFLNQFNYKLSHWESKLGYASYARKRFSYSGAIGAAVYSLHKTSATAGLDPSMSRVTANCALTSNYQFSNRSGLTLTYSANTLTPDIRELAANYVLASNHTLTQGTDTLRLATGHAINLVYNYLDFFKKKLIFVSSLSYGNNPSLYTTDLRTDYIYSFRRFVPRTVDNDRVLFFSRLEKFLVPGNSKLIFFMYGSHSRSYSLVNDTLQQSRFNSGSAEFTYVTWFDKGFYLTVGAKYSINKQVIAGSGVEKTNDIIALNATPGLKLADRFDLTVKANYIDTKTNFGGAKAILLVDLAGDYVLIPKKLNLDLQVNNLFDQSAFANNYSTGFYYSVNQFRIRRTALASIIYKF